MVTFGDRLTGWWTLGLIGYLYHTTSSSSEDWVPWTYGDSNPLTLPTIRSIALLKHVNRSLAVNNLLSKSGSFSWYNMTLVLEILEFTRLNQTSVFEALPLTSNYNILVEVILNHSSCSEPTQFMLSKPFQILK